VKAGVAVTLLLMLAGLAVTACQPSVSIPAAEPTGAVEVKAAAPSPAATPGATDGAEAIVPAPTDSVAPTHVVVYYFHRTIRCETCLKFETLTQRALRGGFAAELASGRIAWRVLDFEQPESETLTSRYDVFDSSVVVSKLVGEREIEWKKLNDIRALAEYEDAFIGYIQEEVGAYLGGAAHGE